MGYYDPPEYRDWEAAMHCDHCGRDEEHLFTTQVGSTMTYATCMVCEEETELHPSDFED